MSKRLGGIIGCKDETSSWHLHGFPDGSNIGSEYNIEEKPTAMLYTYINRHAGTTDTFGALFQGHIYLAFPHKALVREHLTLRQVRT